MLPEKKIQFKFWHELKRRNVFRVATVYIVTGWLMIEIATTLIPLFKIPEWVATAIAILVLIGFPIAVILAWAFEMSPDGFIRTESEASKENPLPDHKKKPFTSTAVIIFLLIIVIAQFFYFNYSSESTSKNEFLEASVAVLPFQNLSSDKEQEYFSDGLTEELLDNLAKIPRLRVPARTSSFAFKGKQEDIKTIGKKLNVMHILEGSVRRSNSKLRITAQLIKVGDGFHIWSETYDREMTDIFSIQDEIAASIVTVLKLKLLGEETTVANNHGTKNTDAYVAYLLGRQHLRKRNVKDLTIAVQSFEKAVDLDSNFVQAVSGLSDATDLLYEYGSKDPALKLRSDKLTLKALQKNPDLAESQTSYGRFLMNTGKDEDLPLASQAYAKALQINPNYIQALAWNGIVLKALGRNADAIANYHKALKLDPLSSLLWTNLKLVQERAGMFEDALSSYDQILEIDPTSPFAYAQFIGTYFYELPNGLKRTANLYDKIPAAIKAEFPQIHHYGILANLALKKPEKAKEIIALNKADLSGAWNQDYLIAIYQNQSDQITAYVNTFRNKANYINAHAIGISLLHLKNYKDAIPFFLMTDPYLSETDLQVHEQNMFSAIHLAYAYLQTDQKDKANQLFELLREKHKTYSLFGIYGYFLNNIKINWLTGKKGEAISEFNRIAKKGYRSTYWLEKKCPLLEDFFQEEAVQEAVRLIELDIAQQSKTLN